MAVGTRAWVMCELETVRPFENVSVDLPLDNSARNLEALVVFDRSVCVRMPVCCTVSIVEIGGFVLLIRILRRRELIPVPESLEQVVLGQPDPLRLFDVLDKDARVPLPYEQWLRRAKKAEAKEAKAAGVKVEAEAGVKAEAQAEKEGFTHSRVPELSATKARKYLVQLRVPFGSREKVETALRSALDSVLCLSCGTLIDRWNRARVFDC